MIIRTDSPAEFKMIENDVEKSIMQNVLLIASTKVGTVPGYRDFGLEQNGLDAPLEVAKTLISADIFDAVGKFEPRCEINDIAFETNADGKLTAILEVHIRDE